MRITFGRWLSLGALCLAAPLEAWSAEPSAFSWSRLPGAESCPGLGDVSARVDRLLRRRAFVAPAEALVFFEASIAPRGSGGFVVRIVLLRPDQEALGTRELESPQADCSAAAEAAALALALMIDPDVETQAASSGAPARVQSPAQSPSTLAARAGVPTAKPAGATNAAPLVEKPPAFPCPAPQDRWRVRLSAGPGFGLGMLPEPGIGIVAGAQVTPPKHRLSAEVYGGFLWPRRRGTRNDAGADFWATFAGLNGSWAAVRAPQVRWSLGAGFWAGVIEAEAFGFTSSYYASAWQLALGMHSELEVSLGERTRFLLRPNLLVPTKRETFEVSTPSGPQALFTSAPVQLTVLAALAFAP